MKFIIILALSSSIAFAKENYPQDIQKTFLTSCIGMSKELIEPCKCILVKMQEDIPFKEFETIIAQEDPMASPKVRTITNQCIRQ